MTESFAGVANVSAPSDPPPRNIPAGPAKPATIHFRMEFILVFLLETCFALLAAPCMYLANMVTPILPAFVLFVFGFFMRCCFGRLEYLIKQMEARIEPVINRTAENHDHPGHEVSLDVPSDRVETEK